MRFTQRWTSPPTVHARRCFAWWMVDGRVRAPMDHPRAEPLDGDMHARSGGDCLPRGGSQVPRPGSCRAARSREQGASPDLPISPVTQHVAMTTSERTRSRRPGREGHERRRARIVMKTSPAGRGSSATSGRPPDRGTGTRAGPDVVIATHTLPTATTTAAARHARTPNTTRPPSGMCLSGAPLCPCTTLGVADPHPPAWPPSPSRRRELCTTRRVADPHPSAWPRAARPRAGVIRGRASARGGRSGHEPSGLTSDQGGGRGEERVFVQGDVGPPWGPFFGFLD